MSNQTQPRTYRATTQYGEKVELHATDYAEALELAEGQGMTLNEPRPLSTIAREIARCPKYAPCRWCAEPYRRAMLELDSLADSYGADSARSIVLYLLANLGQWRGDTARRIKAELKGMLKESKR